MNEEQQNEEQKQKKNYSSYGNQLNGTYQGGESQYGQYLANQNASLSDNTASTEKTGIYNNAQTTRSTNNASTTPTSTTPSSIGSLKSAYSTASQAATPSAATTLSSATPSAETTLSSAVTPSATTGTLSAAPTSSNGLEEYMKRLSQYDLSLPSESQEYIAGNKKTFDQGQKTGNKAVMRDSHINSQLERAMIGGYIANPDGTGYIPFGYDNLADWERNEMSIEDQNEILRAKLGYMYATTPEDKAYWNEYANQIRGKYGYTSKDGGKTRTKLDLLTTEYGGYNQEFNDPYESQISDLVSYISGSAYDPETDPAYQAYKAQYERNANAAANKALAQSAGNTGGIANSYATALANAAQQAYMKQLTDVIPTLQVQDYDRKQGLLNSLYNFQNSAYNRYNTDRDVAFQNWLQNWTNAYNLKDMQNSINQANIDRDWTAKEAQKDRDLDTYLTKLVNGL